jgi:hypothetical protein
MMIDETSGSMEERLTMLEAKVRKAQEDLREFEAWRRRSIRSFLVGVACVAGLTVIVAQTPATRGKADSSATPMTVRAPFQVDDTSGHKIFDITQRPNGSGVARFYSTIGQTIVAIGANDDSTGGFVTVADPLQHFEAEAGATSKAGAFFAIFPEQNAPIAVMGTLGATSVPDIELHNKKGVAAQLMVSDQTGKLLLTDAELNARVLAGTEKNGDGTVKVSGPKGECYPAFVGLPCMIVAH